MKREKRARTSLRLVKRQHPCNLKDRGNMGCQLCDKNIFREKLGRCRSCMWLNFFLLTASAGGWFICSQSAPKQVETIALLLTFLGSALLMSLHIGAYLYYRYKGIKNPTQDRHIPK